MQIAPLSIPDVLIVEPKIFPDDRGFFFESYNKEALAKSGIKCEFVQDNFVSSSKGVLRGLHYQISPKGQAKLLRVIHGAVYDVAVDVRKNSPTFGQYAAVRLDADSKKMIFIPEGFAHGYLALEDETAVLYKVSNFYSPEHERGIRWDDGFLKIEWPKLDRSYQVSEKDKSLPAFEQLKAEAAKS